MSTALRINIVGVLAIGPGVAQLELAYFDLDTEQWIRENEYVLELSGELDCLGPGEYIVASLAVSAAHKAPRKMRYWSVIHSQSMPFEMAKSVIDDPAIQEFVRSQTRVLASVLGYVAGEEGEWLLDDVAARNVLSADLAKRETSSPSDHQDRSLYLPG